MSDGLIAVAVSVLVFYIVPAAGMRISFPWLERVLPRVRNYRGNEIAVGLGVVWIPVVIVIALMRTLDRGQPYVILDAWPLVATVAVLGAGMLDDALGQTTARGFRGHLSALRSGRITTGIVKLGVITLVSAWAAWHVIGTSNGPANVLSWRILPGWIAGTVLIAGSANLVNLLDLRPGRALKGYFAMVGLAMSASLVWSGAYGPESWESRIVLGLALVGPAVAVWPLDVGERGTLGDGGSNTLGFVAGYWLATLLPFPLLAAAGALVLGVNLASEEVSFSSVIERSSALRWLDGLGRVGDARTGAGSQGDSEQPFDATARDRPPEKLGER